VTVLDRVMKTGDSYIMQTCKIHILNKEALDKIAFGMEV